MEKTNIVILGHVDHGKSTLIGRLLYDSGSLMQERIDEVKRTAEKLGKDMEFAFFIDSLEEEREDAMTIDIMHIPLKIDKRDYILIDCPGHKELIKNMLSGASEADSAILVISAKENEGIQEQTKRHLFLAKMLGIEQVFFVINKMDEMSFDEKRFNDISNSLSEFLKKIGYDEKKIFFIPISAKYGENIFKKSEKIGWYKGDCLTDLLNKRVSFPPSLIAKPLGAVVQDVYDIDSEKIVIAKIETGKIDVNDSILFNLCEEKGIVKDIRIFGEERNFAEAGESIGLEIERVDFSKVKRGDVISKERLNKTKEINARIFILSETQIKEGDFLQIRCGTAEKDCQLKEIMEKIDSSSSEKIPLSEKLVKNTEIALVSLSLQEPIIAEKFAYLPFLGRFLLIKEKKIVAVGIVV